MLFIRPPDLLTERQICYYRPFVWDFVIRSWFQGAFLFLFVLALVWWGTPTRCFGHMSIELWGGLDSLCCIWRAMHLLSLLYAYLPLGIVCSGCVLFHSFRFWWFRVGELVFVPFNDGVLLPLSDKSFSYFSKNIIKVF